MRGRKESVGSIKEGTRSKSRTVGGTTAKGSVKESGRTVGLMETGHGSSSKGSRKMTAGKGVSHK